MSFSWLLPVVALAAQAPASDPLLAVELRPDTLEAFERHIEKVETRWAERDRKGHFLGIDEQSGGRARLRGGEIVIERYPAPEIDHGTIHDWVGTIFLPNTTLAAVTALVQNYDRHAEIYKPEVVASRTVQRDGNDYKIFLRLLKKKVLTVVLDTEHDVRYLPLDAKRMRSWSKTTSIREVQNAGKSGERVLPPGKDHGFLWRLDSYWTFLEADGGVYVECNAVSLTRDVPAGVGWIINPIVRDLPRESLASTLRAKKTYLSKP